MIGDDVVADGEAEAGPALPFAGEKRFEDERQVVGRDTAAAVADADSNVALGGGDLDDQLTPVRHRVESVIEQIEHNLLEAIGVHTHRGDRAADPLDQRHLLALALLTQQEQGIFDHRHQRPITQLEIGQRGKAQHLVDQRLKPFDLPQRPLNESLIALIADQPVMQFVKEQADPGQRVPHLMGDKLLLEGIRV